MFTIVKNTTFKILLSTYDNCQKFFKNLYNLRNISGRAKQSSSQSLLKDYNFDIEHPKPITIIAIKNGFLLRLRQYSGSYMNTLENLSLLNGKFLKFIVGEISKSSLFSNRQFLKTKSKEQ